MARCEAYIARPRAAPSPALSISSSSSSSCTTTSGPSTQSSSRRARRYARCIDLRLRRKLDAVKRIIERGEDITRVARAGVAFAVAFANVQRVAPRPGMIDERDPMRRIYFRDVDDARTFIHPSRPWDFPRMKHRHCRRVMELPPMLRRSAEPGRDALARRR